MKRIRTKSHVFSWIAVVIALLFILHPLIGRGFFVSDDGDWMIIRLSAFYQDLREGQFPVRFLGRLNNSYGYPVANFLYPGFLYIGSFLHAAGASFVQAVKIIFAGSMGVGAWFIYLWLRKYVQSTAAAVGAVSFVLLPYIGFDLYTRGSVGEILAICAAAIAVYSVAWDKRRLFAAALGLLILAHNSLAVIFAGILFLYIIAEKKLRLFLYPAILGLGMSAFFWLPALAEQGLTVFGNRDIAASGSYFITGQTFYLIGSSLFFIIFPLIVSPGTRRVWFFVSLSAIAIFLASPWSGPIWTQGLAPRWFQFPFRFLSVLAITVPFLAAQAYEGGSKKYRVLVLVIACLLWIVDGTRTLSRIERTDHGEAYYVTNEATTTVQNEYMPRWITVIPSVRDEERIVFYSGRGRIDPPVYTRHAFTTTIVAEEDSVMQINTIYYPGWGASVDGQFAQIDYDNPAGLMRIAVARGPHRVVVAFRETVSRFIVDCVSLVSGILFVIFLVRRKKTS